MQKLISRNKNGSECSTPISTQSHDMYVFIKMALFYYNYIVLCFIIYFRSSLNHIARLEKEKEINRTTPPRYQKNHINGNLKLTYIWFEVNFIKIM